jgi:predicted RNA binding protein with dsRBD fold (UPF0201 family)
MKIDLYEMFKTDTLRHRDTARKVLEISKAPPTTEIIIDFQGIIFASRSFCHELRNGLNERKVTYENMSPEVNEMMQIVRIKPKIKPRKTFNHKKLELPVG